MKQILILLALFSGLSSLKADTQLIYAAHKDGTITVHDINRNHAITKTVRFTPSTGLNLNGICAAVPTHRLYVTYYLGTVGHIVALDLLNDAVLWDNTYATQLDRFDILPNGSKLYVPTYEGNFTAPYELVLDASDGHEITRITMPICTHDTFCSLDGTKVFMENKKGTTAQSGTPDGMLRIVDPITDTVVTTGAQVGGDHVMQPFSVSSNNQLIVANVRGINGFQTLDGNANPTGTWLFPGAPPPMNHPHGIGFKPDETEVWVNGFGEAKVHVFNMTGPTPVETHTIVVPWISPHWLTFNIDGRFCYISAPAGGGGATQVISTATYTKVTTVKASEELIEIDFLNGVVTKVGSQFSPGRR